MLSAYSYRNAVWPSVCLSVAARYQTKHKWDRNNGFSPYDSVETPASCEQMLCRWVRRFYSNEGIKEGYPLRNRYFTAISSGRVRTVADGHRLAAHHNKHCWRPFPGYQHRWPWTSLNPQVNLVIFFAISRCHTHFKGELRRNNWR